MKLPFVSRNNFDEAIRMYEEAVYKLECLLCHATGGRYSKGGYSLPDMERMVDDHIDALIEEATAEVEAGALSVWISVDDRLPAENAATIISTKLGEVYQARYKQGVWIGPYGMTWTVQHVTHWQPLPKPAKSRRR